MSFNKENQTPLDIALSCTVTTKKEKLVADLRSIGQFGQRDFEVKRKYKYMKDETETGGKIQQREDAGDKANKSYETEFKNIMNSAEIDVVVAALIMTVTFTAGFTLPGGFESDPDSPNQGMAILIRKTAFRAFVLSDAIAFTCSAVAILVYFATATQSRGFHISFPRLKQTYYNIAGLLQLLSICAVVIAFATGMFATLAHSLGIAVTVCFISGLFFPFMLI